MNKTPQLRRWHFFRSGLALCLLSLLFLSQAFGQINEFGNTRLRYPINEDGSHYIGFSLMFQGWIRHTWNNPGSTLFDEPRSETTDLSIRRYRIAVFSQVTDRLFLFTQLGDNNFNIISPQGFSINLLDAFALYKVTDWLQFGGGKSAFNGISRFSAPSASRQIGGDVNLVFIPTINVADDLLRNLSLFARGDVGKFHYRVAWLMPLNPRANPNYDPTPVENIAKFNGRVSNAVFAGYFKFDFLEKETIQTPFYPATNFGSKRLLNLGAGFQVLPEATWHLENGNLNLNDVWLGGVDLFLDMPLGEKGAGLNTYAAFLAYDFGPNYIRNIGANNPANGLETAGFNLNGPGNAFPMIGSGLTGFLQMAWWSPVIGDQSRQNHIMPFANIQYSDFDGLDPNVLVTNVGITWAIRGHLSKATINYQNWPVFSNGAGGNLEQARRGSIWLVYQIGIN